MNFFTVILNATNYLELETDPCLVNAFDMLYIGLSTEL